MTPLARSSLATSTVCGSKKLPWSMDIEGGSGLFYESPMRRHREHECRRKQTRISAVMRWILYVIVAMQPEKADGDYIIGSIRSQTQCTIRDRSKGSRNEVICSGQECAQRREGGRWR